MARSCRYCGDEFDTLQGLGQHTKGTHGKPWIPRKELVELYEEQVYRIAQIAKVYSTTPKTIRQLLDEYGIEQRDPLEERRRGLQLKPASYYTKPSGYEHWRNEHDGETSGVYVHRLLAVAEYGFEAVRGKEVHHKNGIKWDNRPSNIKLIEKSEHGRIHAQERWGTG